MDLDRVLKRMLMWLQSWNPQVIVVASRLEKEKPQGNPRTNC